jgi:hypothetical protein
MVGSKINTNSQQGIGASAGSVTERLQIHHSTKQWIKNIDNPDDKVPE